MPERLVGMFICFCHIFMHNNVTMANASSVASRVGVYVANLKPGTVFTPAELAAEGLGSPAAVRQALHRLASSGRIRRLSKGYYDLPQTSPKIGRMSPTRDAIVAAISRKTGARIEKPQLDAANALGLSDQVVARPAYRTDLTNRRRVRVGDQTIELLRTAPRSLRHSDDTAGQVIDALRALGRRHVSDAHIESLRKAVATPELRAQLRQRAKRAPQWIAALVRRIA